MSADPEAVTRALAEHAMTNGPDDGTGYREVACRCGWTQDGYGHRAHLASVLASLPDDRLAEAEAKVRRVEAKLEEWGHDPECESLTCLKGDGSTREPADCDCYYAEFRAALSGGDATARPEAGLHRADGSLRGY